MKKIFVLFLFAASAMFVSCNSDDDNNGGNEEKIIGKWEFYQDGTIVNGQEILVPYENEAPECGKDFIDFKEDNTVQSVIFFLDFNDDCDSETDNGTYSISGNNITLITGGETVIAEIETLNNTTLKLKVTEEFGGETFVYLAVLKKV